MNIGFLFKDENTDWHIVSENGIFMLHPKDRDDPMLCLKHNDIVRYNYVDSNLYTGKPYAKITNFIKS
jgi:hypothetical protein